MVIRGNIRGNGVQLAHYLLSGEANENVQILDVAGRPNATERYLHQTMQGMSLTAELTKSQKGLYHAQINPAYREDRKMSHKDWLKATDILAHELGLTEQRRVIVLHTKKNRTHAHVVFERYDHQTGKVVDNKFSRLAQDRARNKMERVFEHAPTPHRNKHQPELKDALTALWQKTITGAEFVKAVHDNGYLLAQGVPRHPFMVVDDNGRSFDLVRQLKGVRIKEVRGRLRGETLIPEKEAITIMQQQKEGSNSTSKVDTQTADRTYEVGRPNVSYTFQATEPSADQTDEAALNSLLEAMQSFVTTGQELSADRDDGFEKKKAATARIFIDNKTALTNVEAVSNEEILHDYKENGDDQTVTTEQDGDAGQQVHSDNETDRFKETLTRFLDDEDELVANPNKLDADRQRQQDAARHFISNQADMTTQVSDEDAEIRRMIEEQKTIRERSRQRTKKRLH